LEHTSNANRDFPTQWHKDEERPAGALQNELARVRMLHKR